MLGSRKRAMIKDETTVATSRFPKIFKLLTWQKVMKNPENKEVNAPPRIVDPISPIAASVLSDLVGYPQWE